MKKDRQIKLDPSRLYGFRIASRPTSQQPQRVALTAKIGEKLGNGKG